MQVMAGAAFITAGPPTSSPSLVPAKRDHEAQKPYVACNAPTLVGMEAPSKSAAIRALNTLASSVLQGYGWQQKVAVEAVCLLQLRKPGQAVISPTLP